MTQLHLKIERLLIENAALKERNSQLEEFAAVTQALIGGKR